VSRNRSLFDEPEPEASGPHEGPCVEVALDVPLDRQFTYALPPLLARDAEDVAIGARVLVPFGARKLVGVVVDRLASPPPGLAKLKAVLAVVDRTPVLPAELLGFLREVASYYLSPLGEVLALALPAIERKTISGLRAKGHALETSKVAPKRTARFVARGVADVEGARHGKVADALIAKVRAEGEIALEALATEWSGAREIVARLAKKGVLVVQERELEVRAFDDEATRDVAPTLTDEQQEAVSAITASLDDAAGEGEGRKAAPLPFLLHGVTGSGKTEVYLRAIAHTLSLGRGALMLVPEIALTPQLVARFRARFGDDVAVVHSALDPAARFAMWRKLHEGKLRVAIGARSALFAPVPSLGLVVVDEEHDPSFKQEEGVRYHARDCAILRAVRARAVCVLGSATPSLESVELVHQGRARRLVLAQRARSQPLPKVEIVDLRHVGAGPSGSKQLSLPLHRALEATLAAGEQAILFLNRRGFAPAVRCESCGEMSRCPDCDVALTFHRAPGTRARRDGAIEGVPAGLRCHYCDRVEPLPTRCPKCGGRLALEGAGTERLEDVLAASFPRARVARLDRDVASGKETEKILDRVRAREVDVLVGTQMVTKGHDLPFVTLVGVVNADAALSMPDFRAAERTFQLLVQVAGRAGRGDAPGRVIVQTRTPEHAAIRCAAAHDVASFQDVELRDREELGYPPFSRLVLIRLDGPTEEATARAAAELASVATALEVVQREVVEVRGPTPAPVPRVRNRFRYRILLKGPRKELREVARAVKRALEGRPREVRVVVDVDPLAML
jgi:primosomal protein N' (replication factor Y)